MARQPQQQTSSADVSEQATNFTVFRVPGSRYGTTAEPTGAANARIPRGVPLTVGPSIGSASSQSGSSRDLHRNSYTSTLPSSPYRESLAGGDTFDDDFEGAGIGWMRSGRVVRVKETGQSYRFPLEEENMPQIALSSQDIAQLRESMELTITKAVNQGTISWMENPTLAPVNSKYQWKVHLEKKNCIMYRRKNDPTLMRNFLIRAKLDTTMDDLMYGLINDTTDDERTHLAHIYRDDFLDGAVLQLLERPTIEDPYHLFAIKWAAQQSPVDSMFAIRDHIYVEYSKTVTDSKGQKIVARVLQSINAREFNVAEREFGFVRNEISWTQLFRVLPGSNESRVDLSMSGSVRFPNNANTPSWLANRFLSSMYSVTAGMSNASDAKHIVNQSLVSDKPWVPNHERSACSCCLKSFSFLRHRHHCRICAEIMCTSCTLELALRTSELPTMMRPEGGLISAEKFCFKCIEQGRRDRVALLAQARANMAAAVADMARLTMESDNNKENDRESSGATYEREFAVHARPGRSPQLGDDWISNDKLQTPAGEPSAAPFRPRNNLPSTAITRQPSTEYNASPSAPTSALARPSEDHVDIITPMPSTFARMEQSIAAQQQLLRTMMLEGQKMMQQQPQYPSHSSRGYVTGPAIEVGPRPPVTMADPDLLD